MSDVNSNQDTNQTNEAQEEQQSVAVSQQAQQDTAPDPVKIDWVNYFFHTDFSNDIDTLKDIPEGPVTEDTAKKLTACLSSHDQTENGGRWSASNEPLFGLLGVNVVFNGQNSTDFPTKFTFNQALAIQFPESQEEPPAGTYLYLSYNVDGGQPTIKDNTAYPEGQTDAGTGAGTAQS